MEKRRSPLISVDSAPAGRGFSRHEGLSSDDSLPSVQRERRASRAARHRLDEPTRLSLGMVASLQSPPPFHLVTVILALDTVNPYSPFREAQTLPGPPKPVLQTDSTSFD